MPSQQPARVVPVIVGPTASGKTEVAIELAKLLEGEIISADSRQVYKHLNIGTAKPSRAQQSLIKHHFIDLLEPDQEFNAGEFGELGRSEIDRIFDQGKVPIVAGGSGLYVQSLVDGFFDGPGADREYREYLERLRREHGIMHLMEKLLQVDPVSAARIEPTRLHRVIRALEVFHLTGKPISELHQQKKIRVTFQPLFFGLQWERKELYARIDSRCDAMLEAGLLEEVDEVLRRGFSGKERALNTVGYAEALAYKRSEIPYDEMVRLLKQNSRRYAKRQLTWLRRDQRIEWIVMNGRRNCTEVAGEIGYRFPQ